MRRNSCVGSWRYCLASFCWVCLAFPCLDCVGIFCMEMQSLMGVGKYPFPKDFMCGSPKRGRQCGRRASASLFLTLLTDISAFFIVLSHRFHLIETTLDSNKGLLKTPSRRDTNSKPSGRHRLAKILDTVWSSHARPNRDHY